MNIDTGSEAPNGGYDGFLLMAVVILGGGLAAALYRGWPNHNLITELQKFVTVSTSDAARNAELARQFQRVDPDVQATVRQLLNVADPLTDFIPGDMDGRVVHWLKEITKKAEAQHPTLPGTP